MCQPFVRPVCRYIQFTRTLVERMIFRRVSIAQWFVCSMIPNTLLSTYDIADNGNSGNSSGMSAFFPETSPTGT